MSNLVLSKKSIKQSYCEYSIYKSSKDNRDKKSYFKTLNCCVVPNPDYNCCGSDEIQYNVYHKDYTYYDDNSNNFNKLDYLKTDSEYKDNYCCNEIKEVSKTRLNISKNNNNKDTHKIKKYQGNIKSSSNKNIISTKNKHSEAFYSSTGFTKLKNSNNDDLIKPKQSRNYYNSLDYNTLITNKERTNNLKYTYNISNITVADLRKHENKYSNMNNFDSDLNNNRKNNSVSNSNTLVTHCKKNKRIVIDFDNYTKNKDFNNLLTNNNNCTYSYNYNYNDLSELIDYNKEIDMLDIKTTNTNNHNKLVVSKAQFKESNNAYMNTDNKNTNNNVTVNNFLFNKEKKNHKIDKRLFNIEKRAFKVSSKASLISNERKKIRVNGDGKSFNLNSNEAINRMIDSNNYNYKEKVLSVKVKPPRILVDNSSFRTNKEHFNSHLHEKEIEVNDNNNRSSNDMINKIVIRSRSSNMQSITNTINTDKHDMPFTINNENRDRNNRLIKEDSITITTNKLSINKLLETKKENNSNSNNLNTVSNETIPINKIVFPNIIKNNSVDSNIINEDIVITKLPVDRSKSSYENFIYLKERLNKMNLDYGLASKHSDNRNNKNDVYEDKKKQSSCPNLANNKKDNDYMKGFANNSLDDGDEGGLSNNRNDRLLSSEEEIVFLKSRLNCNKDNNDNDGNYYDRKNDNAIDDYNTNTNESILNEEDFASYGVVNNEEAINIEMIQENKDAKTSCINPYYTRNAHTNPNNIEIINDNNQNCNKEKDILLSSTQIPINYNNNADKIDNNTISPKHNYNNSLNTNSSLYISHSTLYNTTNKFNNNLPSLAKPLFSQSNSTSNINLQSSLNKTSTMYKTDTKLTYNSHSNINNNGDNRDINEYKDIRDNNNNRDNNFISSCCKIIPNEKTNSIKNLFNYSNYSNTTLIKTTKNSNKAGIKRNLKNENSYIQTHSQIQSNNLHLKDFNNIKLNADNHLNNNHDHSSSTIHFISRIPYKNNNKKENTRNTKNCKYDESLTNHIENICSYSSILSKTSNKAVVNSSKAKGYKKPDKTRNNVNYNVLRKSRTENEVLKSDQDIKKIQNTSYYKINRHKDIDIDSHYRDLYSRLVSYKRLSKIKHQTEKYYLNLKKTKTEDVELLNNNILNVSSQHQILRQIGSRSLGRMKAYSNNNNSNNLYYNDINSNCNNLSYYNNENYNESDNGNLYIDDHINTFTNTDFYVGKNNIITTNNTNSEGNDVYKALSNDNDNNKKNEDNNLIVSNDSYSIPTSTNKNRATKMSNIENKNEYGENYINQGNSNKEIINTIPKIMFKKPNKSKIITDSRKYLQNSNIDCNSKSINKENVETKKESRMINYKEYLNNNNLSDNQSNKTYNNINKNKNNYLSTDISTRMEHTTPNLFTGISEKNGNCIINLLNNNNHNDLNKPNNKHKNHDNNNDISNDYNENIDKKDLILCKNSDNFSFKNLNNNKGNFEFNDSHINESDKRNKKVAVKISHFNNYINNKRHHSSNFNQLSNSSMNNDAFINTSLKESVKSSFKSKEFSNSIRSIKFYVPNK